MRMTVVPHTGHLPLAAFRPFFRVVSSPSNSRLALHFTQYASYVANPFTSSESSGARRCARPQTVFEAARLGGLARDSPGRMQRVQAPRVWLPPDDLSTR